MNKRPDADTLMNCDKVIEIHDLILSNEPGLEGDYGLDALEGALSRVGAYIDYAQLEDVYAIAALYVVALARGHVFADANKRTALVTGLSYLELQGIYIPEHKELEEIMVEVAQGHIDKEELADILYTLSCEG